MNCMYRFWATPLVRASIESIVFPEPDENFRGVVNAFMPLNGKQQRIARATLLVDKAPTVSLEVPSKIAVDQIEAVAETLKAFAAKVREMAQAV
ncbi:hypothetical protein ACQYZY_28640 [Pseudomonas aeruginosa]|uniref:hypothetical protein n=1 Tax=Pseudomonas aeruginosa TaxID=287 RepID=UPI003D2CA2C1